jgi:hypothetical protein
MSRGRRSVIDSAAVALAAIVFAIALTACSHDGRDLQPARPDQTQSILDPTTIPSTTIVTAAPSPTVAP